MSELKFNPKEYVDHVAKEAKNAAKNGLIWMVIFFAAIIALGVVFYSVTKFPNVGILIVLAVLGIAYFTVDYFMALSKKNEG
jgi:K+-sensing histidine kinase KdpD